MSTEEDGTPLRPHTAGIVPKSSSRRSLTMSYLDLRPLPEGVMLDANGATSFDSIGTGDISARSWKDEEEEIKRRLKERLPSSSPSPNNRPSTAPQFGSSISTYSRESPSARNARYLAIQWRSRATQLNISKSMSDIGDTATNDAPSPVRVSDGSDSSQESDEMSVGTLDESIKSQVSDAQKVVEKWQLRWNQRSESMSFCSESTSRDEEEVEESTDMTDSDSLKFAMRPSTAERRALITNARDTMEIVSALKPYPLQPVPSGTEFLSDSQKHLSAFMPREEDENDYEEYDEEDLLPSTDNAPAENNRVMDSIDGNISLSTNGVGNDDQLSDSSSIGQALQQVNNELYANSNTSIRDERNISIVQTFCENPETFVQTQMKSEEIQGESSAIKTKIETASHAVDKSTIPPITKVRKNPETNKSQQPQKEAPNTSNNVKFTGSVQERIEAVKQAKAAQKNKKKKSSKSKKTRPRSSNSNTRTTRETKESSSNNTEQKPIQWEEHDVIFTFGLLTTPSDAPPTGKYKIEDEESTSYKNKLKTKSKLLHDILSNFGEIIRRTKSLGNGSTKYMMCSPDLIPRPVRVGREGKSDSKFA